MKHSLLFAILTVVSAPLFAQSIGPISVPEPSTVSLLAAGIIALGIARRKTN